MFGYKGDPVWRAAHPTLGWSDHPQYGCIVFPGPTGREVWCQFSNGEGWEHVSVSIVRLKPDYHQSKRGVAVKTGKLPNWREMCAVKDLFWDPEDCVVQYHPPHSEYVNCWEVLHLWRPIEGEIPRPPGFLVGPRANDDDAIANERG